MSHSIINILQSQPNYFITDSISDINIQEFSYLVITFDILLLTTLNFVKLPYLDIFQFKIGQISSLVKMTLSKNYDYMKLKYQTILQVNSPQQFISHTNIQIDKYNYEQTGIQKVIIKYKITDKFKLLISQNNQINFSVKFGKRNQIDEFGRFSIFNYIVKIQNKKNLRQIHQLHKQVQNQLQNYDNHHGSFPIIYQINITKQMPISLQYIKNLLQQLPLYNAINTTSKLSHLYICHDMKGGYKQQTTFQNPYSKQYSSSYRYHYFPQTSIFNYFSHKTISIPPRHWRQLCKKYQVKCLGTFIVQPQRIQEQFYLSDQFVYKLVFFAKKYKFDGYLINIQNQVKNVLKLQQWLLNLTNLIHQHIPGSQITWYDSISVKGIIQYQNQVNNKNQIFYKLTDSFYTNYWWNPKLIEHNLKQVNQINKMIYVGNDVWGRGTFGGGQFNIYKAVDQIQSKNNKNLGIALFGPAYTYEKSGKNNPPYFKINQNKLYRGVLNNELKVQNWSFENINLLKQFNITDNKDWYYKVTKLSSENYSNRNLIKVTFTYRFNKIFQNLKSKFDYKIKMKAYDQLSGKIFAQQMKSIQNCSFMFKSKRKLSFLIKTTQIKDPIIIQVKIISTVQSAFSDQIIYIQFVNPQSNWIQQISYSKLQFGQSFNTFFNIGYGDYFFYEGEVIYSGYNFMADYDIPHTLSINHPLQTDFQYNDAFIGGSSLQLEIGPLQILTFDFNDVILNSIQMYNLKLDYKKGSISSIIISQPNGNFVKFNQISHKQLNNGWIQKQYQLTKDNLKQIKQRFFKGEQTSIIINIQSKILLGQFSLSPSLFKFKQNQPQFQLIISESFKVNQTHNNIYLNIELSFLKNSLSNFIHIQRVLFVIDNQFAGFIYLQESQNKIIGKLYQIVVKKQNLYKNIKILDLDNYLISTRFNDIQLSQFKQKNIGYKIKLKNY